MRARYDEGAKQNDPDRLVIWAGAGVGIMDKIQPAKVSPIFSRSMQSKSMSGLSGNCRRATSRMRGKAAGHAYLVMRLY